MQVDRAVKDGILVVAGDTEPVGEVAGDRRVGRADNIDGDDVVLVVRDDVGETGSRVEGGGPCAGESGRGLEVLCLVDGDVLDAVAAHSE